MSTIKSTVLEIGEMAYFEDYPILILFNKTAPDGIREISVMGGTAYTVEDIGYVANKTLFELGHLSMYFKLEEGAELLPGSALLSPNKVPQLKAGDVITFIK